MYVGDEVKSLLSGLLYRIQSFQVTPKGNNYTLISLDNTMSFDVTARVLEKDFIKVWKIPEGRSKKSECTCGSNSVNSPFHSKWCDSLVSKQPIPGDVW